MITVNKTFKFIITIILVLLMVVSCQPSTATNPSETTLAPETTSPLVLPDGIVLAGPGVENACTITYPEGDVPLKYTAVALATYINKVIPSANITAEKSDECATEYQVLLTDPDTSFEAEYAVQLEGKVIKLSGKTTESLHDAIRYFKVFCIRDGYLVIDEELNVVSAAGPKVLSQYPEKYYYYEDIYTPTLAYEFDEKIVDVSKSRLIVSGNDVTDKATWDKGSVILKDYTVSAGDHIVWLALTSQKGDVEVFETTFSCGDGSVMNLYAGEIHAHTSDSDGKETVKEAYRYARDVAKLDFFSVTDHSDSFKNSVYQESHIPNADAYNDPGKFVALYGYEQTYNINTGYYGHLNTINRSALTGRSMNLGMFYREMAKDESAVVMFNHPGYTWGNFLEYDFYSPEFDRVINLSEIKSKAAADYEYALSLTKGWHVSPVYNEDNHSANWGAANEHCGFVLAPALTRQNIIEAFNKNRTYTTSDRTLKIYYKINDEWMGSRLNNPDVLHFNVELSTDKSSGLGTVSIIAEDGIVVYNEKVGTKKSHTLNVDLPPHYDYYYIKVESNAIWAYTAPIWIENREHLTVDSLSQELLVNNSGYNDHRICATVTNHTSEPMKNVTVDFYTTPVSGFPNAEKKPVKTVNVGDIAPGATVPVYADIQYIYTSPRVYADVKGTQNGKDYGAVKYMEISTLYFTEILPLTRDGGTDAFEFFEIYNNSDMAINLASCSIRYYVKAGAKAADLQSNTWVLSGNIEPHSTMVIWVVPEGNKLTVADFNKHFGTKLVEGKDIVMITGINIPNIKPVQLEILRDKTVIGRAWYNWGGVSNVRADTSIMYNYPTDYTMTAKVDKFYVAPTPGSLADGQVPATVTQ